MNGSERTSGPLLIAAAVGVFVIASIVQAIGGSSMFSFNYAEPDSFILDILMNATFYPGWLLSGALLVAGIKTLLSNE
jgi:hypothetical protein